MSKAISVPFLMEKSEKEDGGRGRSSVEGGSEMLLGTVSSGGVSELSRPWPAEAESKSMKWGKLCVGNVLCMIQGCLLSVSSLNDFETIFLGV